MTGTGTGMGTATPATPGDPEEAAFRALTEKISRERGFACASYKEKCLRRRIAVRMRARAVHTYADYARLLDHDATEYERLLDALTINVTKFFRNIDVYETLERTVLPALWSLRVERLRLWSAGCSSGEEPYSIAMLLHRFAAGRGDTSRLARVEIIGSDIDRDSLLHAERGVYALPAAFTEITPALQARYFRGDPPAVVPEIRQMVHFERRDLLRDRPPPGPFHLIFCRNVLIYFDRETQESLFDRFRDVLHPDGFLVLGKVETLLGRTRTLFTPVDARERIFRRL